MAVLSPGLMASCQQALGASISSIDYIGGGDINEARRLTTDRGTFFLKLNRLPQSARMFETEASGLALLREAGAIRIPEVLAVGQSDGEAFLLLEFFETARPDDPFWDNFGRQLAELHRIPQPYFGLAFDNFIGSLPQPNERHATFTDLYIAKRLGPQLRSAREAGLLSPEDESHMHHLWKRLPQLLPEEAPALIHGDLWNGNFLVAESCEAVLIDPAVAYAHREMDLAMTKLFGGFAPRFYRAYENHYATAPGLEERLEIYQLYYLLVHLNLFGSSYAGSVRRILNRFG